ncbi:hypothetical protein F2Q70_00024779 [Brassica cretica]|uniref:Uncharacterized protein n=1 Tax=Brassica cretica TaxID=69181 RepID=A0A8S9L4I3_BRACR|nr:hypothetical protein F2Q70_00024779 [Brassica cretica]
MSEGDGETICNTCGYAGVDVVVVATRVLLWMHMSCTVVRKVVVRMSSSSLKEMVKPYNHKYPEFRGRETVSEKMITRNTDPTSVRRNNKSKRRGFGKLCLSAPLADTKKIKPVNTSSEISSNPIKFLPLSIALLCSSSSSVIIPRWLQIQENIVINLELPDMVFLVRSQSLLSTVGAYKNWIYLATNNCLITLAECRFVNSLVLSKKQLSGVVVFGIKVSLVIIYLRPVELSKNNLVIISWRVCYCCMDVVSFWGLVVLPFEVYKEKRSRLTKGGVSYLATWTAYKALLSDGTTFAVKHLSTSGVFGAAAWMLLRFWGLVVLSFEVYKEKRSRLTKGGVKLGDLMDASSENIILGHGQRIRHNKRELIIVYSFFGQHHSSYLFRIKLLYENIVINLELPNMGFSSPIPESPQLATFSLSKVAFHLSLSHLNTPLVISLRIKVSLVVLYLRPVELSKNNLVIISWRVWCCCMDVVELLGFGGTTYKALLPDGTTLVVKHFSTLVASPPDLMNTRHILPLPLGSFVDTQFPLSNLRSPLVFTNFEKPRWSSSKEKIQLLPLSMI